MNKAVMPALDRAGGLSGDSRAAQQDLALRIGALLAGGSGVLDLGGREIELTGPVVPPAACHNPFARRAIRNGRLICRPGPDWEPATIHTAAVWSARHPHKLTGVARAADIRAGARIEGAGVGRAVHVSACAPDRGELTLSQPLCGPAERQIYSFTLFRHALDFTALGRLGDLTFEGLEIDCAGVASGISLPLAGGGIVLRDCGLTGFRDCGLTSAGEGCRELLLDNCRIGGAGPRAVAVNVNTDAAALRDCRIAAPIVLAGRGHILTGNEFSGTVAVTHPVSGTILTGNRFRDAALELTDEHGSPAAPDTAGRIGGLSVAGNMFTATDPAPEFRWIRLRPHGAGLALADLSVTGNTFAATGRRARRAEDVDSAQADLDFTRSHRVTFEGNVFLGVDQPAMNPATLEFDQAECASVWTLNVGDYLPFRGQARTVTAVAPQGDILTAAGLRLSAMPAARGNAGPRRRYVQLTWPDSCRGRVFVTARIDRPG